MRLEYAGNYLPLIQAVAEGKQLQILDPRGNWKDYLSPSCAFSFPPHRYRIKPELTQVTPFVGLTVKDSKGYWWDVIKVVPNDEGHRDNDTGAILMGATGSKTEGELGWVGFDGEGCNHTTKSELIIPAFKPTPIQVTVPTIEYRYANQYVDGRWGMLYSTRDEALRMCSPEVKYAAVQFMEVISD